MSIAQDVDVADADIYHKHRDDLIRFASVLVGRDEAPDVISTVVLRILSRRRLCDLEDPGPYLFRAVLNEARSVHRRRGRAPVLPLSAPESGISDPDIDWGVVEAVADLPARQRAAVFFVYWMDYTASEAARLMGAREGTVHRYLHLARRRLRSVLDEQ